MRDDDRVTWTIAGGVFLAAIWMVLIVLLLTGNRISAQDYGPQPSAAEIAKLEPRILTHMLNPASYEHIKTYAPRTVTYPLKDGSLHGWVVVIKFRGTNAYGGIVPSKGVYIYHRGKWLRIR